MHHLPEQLKAAVFFDGYSPLHETKDPGLITIGLSQLGYPTTLITETKTELDGYEAPFALMMEDRGRFRDVDFWRRTDSDVVICYTWLEQTYNSIVRAIAQSGRKVLVKADTDGRLGYPVVPRYQNQYVMATPPLKVWYKFSRLEGKIEQMEMASGVLIESPGALGNIRKFLGYWKRSDLISKFHILPNPVTDDISKSELKAKEQIMMSVGRWSASIQKNTSMMLRCSRRFLGDNPEWRFRLVATYGLGRQRIEDLVSKWNKEIKQRVEILGPLNTHNSMAQLLGESLMCFMPSKWESWGIAAAEALCMGCTVVGTPLEPLDFLVAGGFSGTLAKGFAFEDLMQALTSDASKHKQGTYKPIDIAGYWRRRLSIREVTLQICELLTKL
jgi:glycosyltransferase involved in cell wall biosynthesis